MVTQEFLIELRNSLAQPSRAGLDILAKCIDHTILKADARRADIERLCEEARINKFASVCVNSSWVAPCAKLLHGTSVQVCTVVGFPLGAMMSEIKALEAEAAIAQGATEIDMVINIAALKDGDSEAAKKDIAMVVNTCHQAGALLKVIIETCLLSDSEKEKICAIARDCGADFVKTSTGFSTAGATANDVALMARSAGAGVAVKASGGVRSLAGLREMVASGASRIGTSNGLAIIEDYKKLIGLGGNEKIATSSY